MSLSSNASNVLLAKCRARFGKHLTSADITALINCRSVHEVVAYLKSCQLYGDMLSSVDESAVHRRRAEFVIECGFYEQLSTLCRYEKQVGEWFSSYILMKGEMKLLISFLRQLAAGCPNEFLFRLPDFFLNSSSIDFAALLQCRSYSDFLRVMEGTRVYRTLKSLAPAEGEPIDCAMIEHALYNQFIREILEIVDQHYSGDAHNELFELLGTRIDLDCFSHLYRLKRYYHEGSAEIRAKLPCRVVNIRQKALGEMLAAPDAETALDIFIARTGYGRHIDRSQIEKLGVEYATRPMLYSKALRLLRTSVHPTTVLLSYVTLAEIETEDIITIIESVYYKLPPDNIRQLITIDDKAEK